MPEVNKSKQSNGFATEGKSRKTQNQMTTGSSLQNNDPHSNTMPHGSLANRIGHVPAIVTATATSQSTSIPFRKNGENQEFSDLSTTYNHKGTSNEQIKNVNGGTNSAKVRSQTNNRPDMNAKRINYMRQREFANYLRSDPVSVDQSQQHQQMTLSH